jgi:hypothetical protein
MLAILWVLLAPSWLCAPPTGAPTAAPMSTSAWVAPDEREATLDPSSPQIPLAEEDPSAAEDDDAADDAEALLSSPAEPLPACRSVVRFGAGPGVSPPRVHRDTEVPPPRA